MRSDTIFDVIRAERGGVADIHLAFSNFPEGVEGHYKLYQHIMLNPGLPLSRAEREYLAVCVSQANECPYCINHHTAALENQAEESINEDRRRVLELLADSISATPWRSSSIKAEFLEAGFTQDQWQHAVMVASYFNMANRLAFAMNLELEADFEESCR